MYVLRMRLCNDMVYSYVDCLSERACVISHWHAPTLTGNDVTFLWRNKILDVVKGCKSGQKWRLGPLKNKEVRSSAAGQFGGRYPSKLASPHSLNWHGAHQVHQ